MKLSPVQADLVALVIAIPVGGAVGGLVAGVLYNGFMLFDGSGPSLVGLFYNILYGVFLSLYALILLPLLLWLARRYAARGAPRRDYVWTALAFASIAFLGMLALVYFESSEENFFRRTGWIVTAFFLPPLWTAAWVGARLFYRLRRA